MSGVQAVMAGPEDTLFRTLGRGLSENEPMSRHTSIGVGGSTRWYYEPRSVADVRRAVDAAREASVEYFPVGKGSNLIVRDGGYRGLIIHMGAGMSKVRVNKRTVYAEAGASFARLSRKMTTDGRAGLEFGVGIPGSVGGAVRMNAGAFGGDVAGVVRTVRIVGPDGGDRVIRRDDMEFSYRRTSLSPADVVVSASFRCEPGPIDRDAYDRAMSRKDRQPIRERTFGSTFVNPPGDHAARLIDACGLKGRRIGGATVSEMHANFIVNAGGAAKARDVEDLIDLMQREVADRFGVSLETEVVIVGNR